MLHCNHLLFAAVAAAAPASVSSSMFYQYLLATVIEVVFLGNVIRSLRRKISHEVQDNFNVFRPII
jgi:hypothetical protein